MYSNISPVWCFKWNKLELIRCMRDINSDWNCSLTVVKFWVDTGRISCNFHEAVTQKSCCIGPLFIQHIFWYCSVDLYSEIWSCFAHCVCEYCNNVFLISVDEKFSTCHLFLLCTWSFVHLFSFQHYADSIFSPWILFWQSGLEWHVLRHCASRSKFILWYSICRLVWVNKRIVKCLTMRLMVVINVVQHSLLFVKNNSFLMWK